MQVQAPRLAGADRAMLGPAVAMHENPPGQTPPVVLTVAGSDSGGSAGLQADLRTLAACGVHGASAVTCVTVQNSVGVSDVVEMHPTVVAAQVRAVVEDLSPAAAKTGLLPSAEIIEAVARAATELGLGSAGEIPLLVDPVAATIGGQPLLRPEAMRALADRLLPMATLLTPNLDEVNLLLGEPVTDLTGMRRAAKALHDLGPRWVLIKAGHLMGSDECTDLLYDGSTFLELPGPRYITPHTHGSGDVLGSAVCGALARGLDMPTAVAFGKRVVTRSVASAYPLGAGRGPVSPLWRMSPEQV